MECKGGELHTGRAYFISIDGAQEHNIFYGLPNTL